MCIYDMKEQIRFREEEEEEVEEKGKEECGSRVEQIHSSHTR